MIQQAGVIHVSMRDQNPIDRCSWFEESVDFRKDAFVAKLLCRVRSAESREIKDVMEVSCS